jgi:hypothetical protein
MSIIINTESPEIAYYWLHRPNLFIILHVSALSGCHQVTYTLTPSFAAIFPLHMPIFTLAGCHACYLSMLMPTYKTMQNIKLLKCFICFVKHGNSVNSGSLQRGLLFNVMAANMWALLCMCVCFGSHVG